MNDQGRTNPERIEKLSVLILFMIVVMLFAGGLVSGTCNAASNSQEVRVGSELDFPPYAFVDESGKVAGFSVELIKAVTDAMGLSIKISTGSWGTVWSSLVEGRLDVLPIVAKLPERQPLVDFSLPHTETYDAFFVRKGDSPIPNIAAARGKEIVVMRSDAAHHALLERNFQGKLILVDTIPVGLSLISSGKHDAFLCSKLIGTIILKKQGLAGLTVGLTIPDYKRTFSFAVKKGDKELLEKLNQGLLIVKTNGEYDRIYDKWLSFDDPWRKVKKYFLPTIVMVIAIVVIAGFWLVTLQRLVRKRTRELAEKNKMLLHARDDMEARIQGRTAELTQSNQLLQSEITERKQTEKEIQTLARFPSENPNPVLRIARDGTLLYINKAGLSLLPEWHLQVGQSVPSMLKDVVSEALNSGSALLLDLEQRERVYSFFITPIADEGYTNIYGRDITERKQAEEALRDSEKRYRELSIVDGLTQLYNSRHFYFQLEIELDRANRYEQPLTLLLLDLDNFKHFNDTYGHVEGDHVLIRLGQVVKRCLRETDFAYRYGGEEFTILLPMTTSTGGAVTAERIRKEFKNETFSPTPGEEVHVTVSIGLAQYKPQEEMKIFVNRVDQLMYQGKKNGKDRVCCES